MFFGFEIRVFKPLSAQGERGQFPRVDGFSFGRWGVWQRRDILHLLVAPPSTKGRLGKIGKNAKNREKYWTELDCQWEFWEAITPE